MVSFSLVEIIEIFILVHMIFSLTNVNPRGKRNGNNQQFDDPYCRFCCVFYNYDCLIKYMN